VVRRVAAAPLLPPGGATTSHLHPRTTGAGAQAGCCGHRAMCLHAAHACLTGACVVAIDVCTSLQCSVTQFRACGHAIKQLVARAKSRSWIPLVRGGSKTPARLLQLHTHTAVSVVAARPLDASTAPSVYCRTCCAPPPALPAVQPSPALLPAPLRQAALLPRPLLQQQARPLPQPRRLWLQAAQPQQGQVRGPAQLQGACQEQEQEQGAQRAQVQQELQQGQEAPQVGGGGGCWWLGQLWAVRAGIVGKTRNAAIGKEPWKFVATGNGHGGAGPILDVSSAFAPLYFATCDQCSP
jgi:hypothetical protein